MNNEAAASEIIFEMTDAEEGGYCARALGFSIFTDGETMDDLRKSVKEAADCYFDETMDAPKIIRLQAVMAGSTSHLKLQRLFATQHQGWQSGDLSE
jgi:predicted RNase H-like HicB family nuclease